MFEFLAGLVVGVIFAVPLTTWYHKVKNKVDPPTTGTSTKV